MPSKNTLVAFSATMAASMGGNRLRRGAVASQATGRL